MPEQRRACRTRGGCRRRLEAAGRGQLQRDAGEVLRHLRQWHAAHAEPRIVDDDAAALDALQHDEMVEIPMQDAGRLQQCSSSSSSRSGRDGEPELVGDADQVLQASRP